MSEEFYRQALLRLNKRERDILKDKCKGFADEDIWDKIGVSSATFYKDKATLYAKLGLDATFSHKKKKETLQNVICPIFATLEVSLTEKTGEELEATPEMLYLAIQDGVDEKNEIVPDKKKEIIIIEERKPRRRYGRLIFIISVLAILFGTIGYLLGHLKPTSQVINNTPTTNIHPQSTVNSLVDAAIISTNTPTPSPKAIPSITITPIPTNTSLPTATNFPTSFTDNFESGINPSWSVVSGTWITTNGRLTTTNNNYDYNWLQLNAPNWINYRVSANYDLQDGRLMFSVRDSSQKKLVYVLWYHGYTHCWGFYPGTDRNEFDCVSETDTRIDTSGNVSLSVNGNEFIAVINGIETQRISITGWANGGIAIGINCDLYSACTTVDNLKVEPLP